MQLEYSTDNGQTWHPIERIQVRHHKPDHTVLAVVKHNKYNCMSVGNGHYADKEYVDQQIARLAE